MRDALEFIDGIEAKEVIYIVEIFATSASGTVGMLLLCGNEKEGAFVGVPVPGSGDSGGQVRLHDFAKAHGDETTTPPPTDAAWGKAPA